jgi:hypothetical protein
VPCLNIVTKFNLSTNLTHAARCRELQLNTSAGLTQLQLQNVTTLAVKLVVVVSWDLLLVVVSRLCCARRFLHCARRFLHCDHFLLCSHY